MVKRIKSEIKKKLDFQSHLNGIVLFRTLLNPA